MKKGKGKVMSEAWASPDVATLSKMIAELDPFYREKKKLEPRIWRKFEYANFEFLTEDIRKKRLLHKQYDQVRDKKISTEEFEFWLKSFVEEGILSSVDKIVLEIRDHYDSILPTPPRVEVGNSIAFIFRIADKWLERGESTLRLASDDLGISFSSEVDHMRRIRVFVERKIGILTTYLFGVLYETETFLPGPGYTSVQWGDQSFTFNPTQATAIEMLDQARLGGSPDVSHVRILDRIGAVRDNAKLREYFRNHPAWNTLVISKKRGFYRLDL